MAGVGNGSESGCGHPVPHRGWIAPPVIANRGLRLNNSLCRSKVPFRPADGSNRVTWYICGPTVYDSAHIGHARNYVTFDIIRRVLEGFFNYQVFYVMNVTDVDDKIIHRARRNHLLDEFLQTSTDYSKVLKDLECAFEEEMDKHKKKVEVAKEELANACVTHRQQELDEKLKQEELKLKKLCEAFAAAKQKEKKMLAPHGKEAINSILADGAADVLASYLDEKGGAFVTDLGIFRAHAAKYEKDFLEDMRLLGVKPPDVLTRVTEYIDTIIQYVQRILDNGFAYVSNNSVYFDTELFVDAGYTYGKLNPWAVGSAGLASESELNFQTKDKRNSCDFALWKASKSGEPYWDSPWGKGRPGWHIECSAMATDIIGSTIDIHTGGHDLMFPHHDNELAQAEAYLGCSQWVNYFLHSGHLSVEGLKMSKSLKNFITVKEALNKYTARQLRFMFVNQSWDKPMNFSDSVMNEALAKERTFQNFFKVVKNFMRKAGIEGDSYAEGFEGIQRLGDDEKKLQSTLQYAQFQVQERLEDNIDTAGALLALLNLVSAVNFYIDKMVHGSPRPILVKRSAEYVTKMLVIFGLSNASPGDVGFGPDGATDFGSAEVTVGRYLDAVACFRDDIRAAAKAGASKEIFLEMADRFRDHTMVDLGVRLEDKVDGSIWELVDPKILQNEREEKMLKARQVQLNSFLSKMDHKIKELERYKAALIDPKEILKQKNVYSAFDAEGIPTHDADGKELSKKARKDVEKRLKKAEEEHVKLKLKLAKHPTFMDQLLSELQDLERQIQELHAR
eukprot:c28374_g1_i1 orf=1074-3446(-)